MKNIFSTMLTGLSLIFILFIGSSFIYMNLSIGQARLFHTHVIDRIQSSLYEDSVIKECQEEAMSMGYLLMIEDITIYDERRDVKVTLEYTIPGMILMDNRTGVLVGYAR